MEKEVKNFSEMTPEEVLQWEGENMAIVLFGVEENTAISFETQERGEDEWAQEELVIYVDGLDKPIILSEEQVASLTAYLLNNFSATKREIQRIAEEGRRQEKYLNERLHKN